jgi:Tol biopolymer transport system component
LTNDLSSYVGVDVDGARTSLVTSRREATLAVWVGDAKGAEGAEIVPPTSFYGTPRVQWVGERVFYDSEVNGQRSITSVMSSGKASEQLVPDAFAMAATSNGDAIVFMRGAGLWKSSVSTRRQSRLVEQDAIVPVVTSDDRSIVFLSSRTGRQSPWIVSIDGGAPAQIVDTTAEIDSVDVSSSGRLVFLAAYNDKSALVVCDLPRCTNRGEFPLPANFRGHWVRWTADGREVAYVDGRGMNIWSLPLNGKPPHEVTHFADTPGSTISGFAWSRDGRRLAILRSTVRNDVALLRLRPQSAP